LKFTVSSLAMVATLALVPGIWAQETGEIILDAVEFQGLERVSMQLVQSQLEVQPGQAFNPRAVARDLRRLGALRFFTTIQADLDRDRKVLTYIFTEQSVIEDLLIVGNDKVRTRDIRGVLSWKEGDPFAPEAHHDERNAVLNLYSSKGFLNTTVDIVAEELSSGRVGVTYFINEGRKAKIRRIDFEGNTTLKDGELRKSIKTKRARWFFGGKYDENKFEEDLRAIVDAYANRGHLEADIPATEFTYSPNGKKVDVSIHIDEGPQYRVGSLEIANNIVYDDDELMTSIEVTEGKIHDRRQVELDAGTIRTGYEDSGYIVARVTPQVTLDRENAVTHIIHDITEGQMNYVREIKITGNDVTKDSVIRRMVLLSPGDRFDGAAYRATQRRIESSGYFDEVRLSPEEIPSDERNANLLIDVVEGKTGKFNFGGGFSTEENLGGFAEIQLRNFDIVNWPTFSGGGQQFSTRISLGAVRSQYNISFTDPEILGYPLSLGVDLFSESFRTARGSSFTQDIRGFQIRLGKALSPFVTANSSFRFSDVNISDFGFFLSPDLRKLRDPGTTISTSLGITRDTRDRFRDPSSGAIHSGRLEVAGLGGDNEFIKLEHESTWIWSLDDEKKWILSYRTREGAAFPYGSTELVPLQDRYFAGGTSTVRGYDTREIGPKVRTLVVIGPKERIGGELRFINNLEIKYRLSDLLRLYGFFDAGGVWRKPSDFDLASIKTSIGIGIGVDVPALGPIRIDFGFPLNPDSDQGNGRLHLVTSFNF